ncbi:MAG: hypothetical protein RLZZ618_3923 [Pseudomonadota bacterium]
MPPSQIDEDTIPSALDEAGPSTALPRVGFIGVGRMGAALASRLIARGYPVAVHDVDAFAEAQAVSQGAIACATPAGLGASSDVVIVTVPDARQATAALFGEHGAVGMLTSGRAVLLCSTLPPDRVEQIAEALAQRGIQCLDAPISGNPAWAREGHISLMLACSNAVHDEHRTLLTALSSRVLRISERPGDGARTKLVDSLLSAVHLAGAAEALALAERLGLDLHRTLEVIEQSSSQSWITSDRMNRVLRGDHQPRTPVSLLQQDCQQAVALAAEVGAELLVGAQAAALFQRAAQGVGATLDDASLLTLLRSR